jgi:SAM-dependent methyltransferase
VKACGRCGSLEVDGEWRCGRCGVTPVHYEGFRAFAPNLARSSEGFDESFFQELAQIEAGHFWFRARNELIAWALRTYASRVERVLELGCGTGFVLSRLHEDYPSASLVGSDIFVRGLPFANARVPSATLYQLDARHIPFRNEFDVIGAFDVLEHIEEDGDVMRQVASALRPGGVFLATVPQHRALWSRQDVHAHHVRRYSRARVRRLLAGVDMQLVRATSFVSLLLPAMLASRMMLSSRSDSIEGVEALEVREPLNTAFELVSGLERWLIRNGASFPAGGSLLVVARKSTDGDAS